jgi:hypothetical protein
VRSKRFRFHHHAATHCSSATAGSFHRSYQSFLCSFQRRTFIGQGYAVAHQLKLSLLARSMRRALGAKLKFEFLDGSIPAPIDAFDPTYRSWNRCNMLIHSWIMNSVDPSIAQSIVFMENASDVWLDLKERFSQGDLVRVSEL